MDSGLLWSAAANLILVATGIRGSRLGRWVGYGLLARRRFGFGAASKAAANDQTCVESNGLMASVAKH